VKALPAERGVSTVGGQGRTHTASKIAIAVLVVSLITLAFGNAIVSRWILARSAERRVEITALCDRRVEEMPGVGKVVKIEMILSNFSSPEAEIHNVAGAMWSDLPHLVATIKQPGVLYDERDSGGKKEFRLQCPVLPKMSHVWLPTWVYRPPAVGEEILFGAQIVSAETDYRQFRWKLINRDGSLALVILDAGSFFPKQKIPFFRRVWRAFRSLWDDGITPYFSASFESFRSMTSATLRYGSVNQSLANLICPASAIAQTESNAGGGSAATTLST
jgi:hypothetical protein